MYLMQYLLLTECSYKSHPYINTEPPILSPCIFYVLFQNKGQASRPSLTPPG